MKAAARQGLPDVPLRNVRTMDEVIARRAAQRRLSMLWVGLFGLLGLVIASVGIYGVLAHIVAPRTHAIGVAASVDPAEALRAE